MEKKYLFVMEYEDSYTGGTLVAISTESELSKLVKGSGNRMKLITDDENNNRYKLQNVVFFGVKRDDSYCGIEKNTFEKLVSEYDFPQKFKNRVLEQCRNKEFHSGKYIRIDWLLHWGIGEPESGLYVVYKMEVNSELESKIISDTYYCA
jgi:hypothetical protein